MHCHMTSPTWISWLQIRGDRFLLCCRFATRLIVPEGTIMIPTRNIRNFDKWSYFSKTKGLNYFTRLTFRLHWQGSKITLNPFMLLSNRYIFERISMSTTNRFFLVFLVLECGQHFFSLLSLILIFDTWRDFLCAGTFFKSLICRQNIYSYVIKTME